MGKIILFVSILVFIDLLFIITGQICTDNVCSLSSIVFNALINLGSFKFTAFFTELVGDALGLFNSATGIAALLTSTGVIIGAFFATREITILFIPVAFSFALLASDLVVIYSILLSFNPILATLLMGPLLVTYGIVIVDWLRGRD